MGSTSTSEQIRDILAALRGVVLGQDEATRDCVVALLARGHVLLEGVPGTAKTLLVRTLARALDVGYARIQFTPDLMPGDITGISILSGGFLQHQARVMRAEVLAQTREQGLAVAIVEELHLVDDLARRILGHVSHAEQHLPSTMPVE